MRSSKSATPISINSHNSPDKMQLAWAYYPLHFKFDARTSRGSMSVKDTWFIRVYDELTHSYSIGEAAYFEGLCHEGRKEFEAELHRVCCHNDLGSNISSVRFGIETAMRNLLPIVDNAFTRGETGIPINGLIWMGDKATMQQRIEKKLADGFRVLKLKIGGIHFDDEVDLIRQIRTQYAPDTLEIRLDANGAFSADNVMERLKRLAEFSIHSIEQPIRAGQWEQMAEVCSESPIPIALDEELIGYRPYHEKAEILRVIKPSYIIIKPSLCGGLSGANEWVDLADAHDIGWWATSALESNVGLQALAIWLSTHQIAMPQGLGTGMLYTNNVASPLEMRGEYLFYNPKKQLEIPNLKWHT